MDSYDEYIDSLMGQFQNNTITYVWEKPYMETPPSLISNSGSNAPLNNLAARKQEVQNKAMREYILLAAALGIVAYFVIKK